MTGSVTGSAGIGAVKIGNDVVGGSGDRSARILGGLTIGSLTIGGSLIGGGGSYVEVATSAFVCQVAAVNIGPVKVGGDVRGGSGPRSGSISASGSAPPGTLASVSIGGSLVGGSEVGTGLLYGRGSLGPVTIGHDLIGGSITGSQPDLFDAGSIKGGTIASVIIGGSVLAGKDDSDSGRLIENAAIQSSGNIASITVKGSVVGTVGLAGDITRVVFSTSLFGSSEALTGAIGKVTIGGRAEWLNVIAGAVGDFSGNGNAQIGRVTVGGDWIASSIAAGVENWGNNNLDENGIGDDNLRFGDSHDHLIDPSALLGKIGRIIIKGIVQGTDFLTDRFGFVSHTIGSLRINGTTVPIADTILAPLTGDVRLHLV